MDMQTGTASAQFERLAQDYWQFRLDEEPVLGIDHGHLPSRLMSRDSIADRARRRFSRPSRCHELDALTGQQVLSAALLRRELFEARERYRLEEHLWPSMFPFGSEAFVAHAIGKTELR